MTQDAPFLHLQLRNKQMANILITGVAGFIGSALAFRLLEKNQQVIGIDNLNDYYPVQLKKARLAMTEAFEQFEFVYGDIADRAFMAEVFQQHKFDIVVNLAAQAGVRHSITHPYPYVDTNIVGFLNILEGCRHQQVKHLVFASSSSVYGANTKQPFSEHDNVDHPISLYAASKKANELMAHSYAHLYNLPCTGLRFFTVYGPWMRPDAALFKFTQGILAGQPISVFNHGKMVRDFTYIDDIVESTLRIIENPAQPNAHWQSEAPDPATSYAPYRIFNIGNHTPVPLMHYIEVLEKCLDKKANINFMPMQPGDVPEAVSDVTHLHNTINFHPHTSIEIGIARFVDWYLNFYQVNPCVKSS